MSDDPYREMSDDPVQRALYAAGDAAGHWDLGERTVQAFLDHMAEHYCGDMYIENSVGYLASHVRELIL